MATESTSTTTNTTNTAGTSAIYGENGATKRGTKIVKAGSDMNKNSFLKILAAEMSNQDPTATKDSSQMITQMAQFTSMEQMSNLNNTMSTYAANALIGKNVITNVKSPNGQVFTGVVRDVTNKAGNITIGVEVSSGTTTKMYDFNYNEIATVDDNSGSSMETLNTNTAILAAANRIGKKGEFSATDSKSSNLIGVVKGVVKESGVLKLRVQPEGSTEIKVVTIDTLIKLDMVE